MQQYPPLSSSVFGNLALNLMSAMAAESAAVGMACTWRAVMAKLLMTVLNFMVPVLGEENK